MRNYLVSQIFFKKKCGKVEAQGVAVQLTLTSRAFCYSVRRTPSEIFRVTQPGCRWHCPDESRDKDKADAIFQSSVLFVQPGLQLISDMSIRMPIAIGILQPA